ncbi:MAG: metal ABC transporter ATP-binding protein [Deltaproteobacteria bacterium]|nr:metal ABC transporter ATP-binding protein [Deltaproteobacteria bacterium]
MREHPTTLPPTLNSVNRRTSATKLEQTRPDPSLLHVLDVEGVSVDIRGKRIIDDISFWIPKGEFVCLCGPNGAGKSTLLKAIMGLLPTTTGTITLGGKSVMGGSQKIGYVPQRKGFDRDFPARAVDLIIAAARGKWPVRIREDERERARVVLRKIGGERLLDKPLAGLSGGETQRVFLARALINDPSLIILDEPTAGVDARGRGELLELMTSISRSDELAAILVTHNLAAVAQTAERIVYIESGRVLCWGLPDELLGQSSLTALAFQAQDHHKHAAPDEE